MTRLTNRAGRLGTALLWSMLLVGCSSEGTRYALEGTVTLDDQPVTQALIVFIPKTPGASGASGMVSDGKFQIEKKAGAMEGEFDIVFSEIQPDLEDFEARRAEGQSPLNAATLPNRYSEPNECQASVGPLKSHAFEFSLRSK